MGPNDRRAATSGDGGAKIANKHWVQVVATVNGETSLLVGLVPDTVAGGGG
jgi:hypothetical protein